MGEREGGDKILLQYHIICNTSHTAHPVIDMGYKYTQLSHTYPHDGNRRLRSGTLLELRLKNARTLSSQRTILPRINIMGIVGNPTRRTNGSAFSITDKPSLWPTTWTENRYQSYLQIESPVSTTVFSILKQEMWNSLKLRLLVMEQLSFSECSIMPLSLALDETLQKLECSCAALICYHLLNSQQIHCSQ